MQWTLNSQNSGCEYQNNGLYDALNGASGFIGMPSRIVTEPGIKGDGNA